MANVKEFPRRPPRPAMPPGMLSDAARRAQLQLQRYQDSEKVAVRTILWANTGGLIAGLWILGVLLDHHRAIHLVLGPIWCFVVGLGLVGLTAVSRMFRHLLVLNDTLVDLMEPDAGEDRLPAKLVASSLGLAGMRIWAALSIISVPGAMLAFVAGAIWATLILGKLG